MRVPSRRASWRSIRVVRRSSSLDSTVFYPGGGGQPSDRGLLLRGADGRTWTVTAARKVDGEIAHELEAERGAARGRRRAHGRPRLGPPADPRCGPTPPCTRCAASCGATTARSSPAATWSRGRRAWTSSSSACPATSSTPSRRPSTPSSPPNGKSGSTCCRARRHSRSRTSSGPRSTCSPRASTRSATIEIVGLDLQADGGTHVANTREVGAIRVTGYESKGRINKRIRIALVDPSGRRPHGDVATSWASSRSRGGFPVVGLISPSRRWPRVAGHLVPASSPR